MILTKAAFAERMGVDRAQPTRWAARGMPCLPDGRVNVDEAEAWVARHIDSSQRRRRSIGTRAGRGAAQNQAAREAAALLPHYMRHLTEPHHVMAVAMALEMAYRQPANAAILAASLGAPMKVAHALFRAMCLGAMDDATTLLDSMEVPPPPGLPDWTEAPIWERERLQQVDWPKVAGKAGAAVDLEAWEAYGTPLLNEGDEGPAA